MNKTMMDDEDGIFAIRRSSQDKLTYKNIIASAISRCLAAKGTTRFKEEVQNLAAVITFNVSGYNLANELKVIRDRLVVEQEQFIDEQRRVLGRSFFYHAVQAKLKIKVSEWYWNTYFISILQVLASHNLLFDTEKRIPIIQGSQQYDEESV